MMNSKKRFRFGAQVTLAPTAADWREKAQRIEDLGYSTILMPDHVGDYFGLFSALTAAALATSRLRVGTLVLDNDFRHPVILAKEAATLDLLTDGRFELGIGAGWMTVDYDKAGFQFDSAPVRIDRLEESLTALKGMFGEGPFSFSGKHYKIAGLNGFPKPVQKPHPPILIGAGSKRMLRLAAREADIVNVSFSGRAGAFTPELLATGSADATAQKISWVREAAGERLSSIELSAPVFIGEVTDNPRAAAEKMSPSFGMTPEAVLECPHALFGSVDGITEELERRREKFGFSYIILSRDLHLSMAPVVARLANR